MVLKIVRNLEVIERLKEVFMLHDTLKITTGYETEIEINPNKQEAGE